MKRTELVAALRDLQGRVYGMHADALINADRFAEEERRAGYPVANLWPSIVGGMTGLSKWIASDIDKLIEQIQQPQHRRRSRR